MSAQLRGLETFETCDEGSGTLTVPDQRTGIRNRRSRTNEHILKGSGCVRLGIEHDIAEIDEPWSVHIQWPPKIMEHLVRAPKGRWCRSVRALCRPTSAYIVSIAPILHVCRRVKMVA